MYALHEKVVLGPYCKAGKDDFKVVDRFGRLGHCGRQVSHPVKFRPIGHGRRGEHGTWNKTIFENPLYYLEEVYY